MDNWGILPLAIALTVLLSVLVLFVIRFVKPRILYGVRHVVLLARARRLFLARKAGRRVEAAKFATLLAHDYRHESLDFDLEIVLTRVSRIRELYRLLEPSRQDVPRGMERASIGVCVSELAEIIRNLAKRVDSVEEYAYPVLPAEVILGYLGNAIGASMKEEWRIGSDLEVEEWLTAYPMSVEQVLELLIAVIFALALRERVERGAVKRGGQRRGILDWSRVSERKKMTVAELLSDVESRRVEFKESLRWDVRQGKMDKRVGEWIVKTISGFLNTEGGTLVVGVDDKKKIVGIERDQFDSDDRVKLYVNNLVSERVGAGATRLIEVNVEIQEGKKIVRVECAKSRVPVFARVEGEKKFFIRGDGATRALGVEEVSRHIQAHFERP